jgi:hypothetical protein
MPGQRRTEVLLEPLARLIGGSVSNGRLHGNHEGLAVEAWGVRERPSHARIKAIKAKGSFPSEDAARKLLYLAIQNAVPQWTHTRGWTKA